MRPSVRLSVCLSETKIWSTFRSVMLEFKGVRGADVQQKFGPTLYNYIRPREMSTVRLMASTEFMAK